MPQACPGCGREYTRRDVLCPCGYAERALHFARRPTAPPQDWLARVWGDGLVKAEIERAAREAAKPAKPAKPPPPTAPPVPKPVRRPQPKPKPKPREAPIPVEVPVFVDRWQRRTPTAHELKLSKHRVALIHNLGAESRFCDQRTEAAHRNFLKILERVCPPEEIAGWPEPLGLGRSVQPYRLKT